MSFPRERHLSVRGIEVRKSLPETALDDACADGVTGEASGVVDVQLRHQVLPVFVDRFEAHAQFRGNVLVGFALRDELEHLQLPRTQAIARGPGLSTFLNSFGNQWAEECVPF